MNEYNIADIHTNGIAVVPYPSTISNDFNFTQFIEEQVEFINPTENDIFVMGGFGAYGTPSSYHHPALRKIRTEICNYTKEQFKNIYPNKYFEFIPDRFAVRKPGSSVSPESWHRDISNIDKNKKIHGNNTDIIYGGWVNLDKTQSQTFSCVPKTHIEPVNGMGFYKIEKDDAKLYKSQEKKINVPPNHMIIFNEKTVHRIAAVTQKNTSIRVFMKYKISDFPNTLFPITNTKQIINSQGVFPISVDQLYPPMYAKLHIVNWSSRLNNFSNTVKPVFCCETTNRVNRHMCSLEEASQKTGQNLMYPPYTENEKFIYNIHKL